MQPVTSTVFGVPLTLVMSMRLISALVCSGTNAVSLAAMPDFCDSKTV